MNTYNESLHKSEVTKYRRECATQLSGKILDVGGGLGSYLPFFASKDVTVLDVDQETIDRLDHKDKIVADALNMPFEDNTYDNVWACAVCQYFHFDISLFIEEAKRVCVAGGRILILVPNRNSIWSKLMKLLGLKNWDNQEGMYRQYSVEELRKYGKVYGEIRFLPFEALFRAFPKMGHTLMLEVINEK